MTFKEKFKGVIQELDKIELEDDFTRDKLWDKEVKIVTEDINEAIKYFKTECTGREFVKLSEIFDQVMEVIPSKEFIDTLYFLAEKYPEETKDYNIMSFIKSAESYLN